LCGAAGKHEGTPNRAARKVMLQKLAFGGGKRPKVGANPNARWVCGGKLGGEKTNGMEAFNRQKQDRKKRRE